MIVRARDTTVVLDKNGAVGKRIGLDQNCEFVKLELAPGGEIPPHALDMPVTFYVLFGKGSVSVQEESFEASQGDLITVKPGLQRGWYNTSTDDLHVLVVKHMNE